MFNNDLNDELLDAVILNDATEVHRLIELGADPNYFEDRAQLRPVHFAALYNAQAAMKILVTAGASLENTNEQASDPISIAKEHGHVGMLELLRKFTSPHAKSEKIQ